MKVIKALEGLTISTPIGKQTMRAKDHQANVIGMSALLTTTMMQMKTTVEALQAAGLKGKVKTMVGGAPVTMKFAMEIGADGYSPDALGAVDLAKTFLHVFVVRQQKEYVQCERRVKLVVIRQFRGFYIVKFLRLDYYPYFPSRLDGKCLFYTRKGCCNFFELLHSLDISLHCFFTGSRPG
jgi:hypothetical protein